MAEQSNLNLHFIGADPETGRYAYDYAVQLAAEGKVANTNTMTLNAHSACRVFGCQEMLDNDIRRIRRRGQNGILVIESIESVFKADNACAGTVQGFLCEMLNDPQRVVILVSEEKAYNDALKDCPEFLSSRIAAHFKVMTPDAWKEAEAMKAARLFEPAPVVRAGLVQDLEVKTVRPKRRNSPGGL